MLSNTRLAILSGSAVILMSSLGAPSALAATLVSGSSPYAGCTIGGAGTVYVGSEVEPWVATNPANPANIIGAWQQDRWSNGGARGLVAGYSNDGGATWSRTTMPFSACAGPGALQYERASDPWLSIGPDGTAYAVSLSFNNSNNSNAVGAAVSHDGGATWINLNVIQANNEPSLQFFNDKESVTANPVKAGTAYAVWDRLELPNDNPYANRRTAAYRGPTLFSKTTDGGLTWSTPKVIVDVPARQQTIGNQIVVDPLTGTLYNFFNFIKPPFGVTAFKVAFIKSDDDGATWTKPRIIADLRSVGVTDPVTGEPLRTGDIIPEPAIDPESGQLYVVWQDSRFNGGHYDEVALATSSDGGATWSAPVRVNTPTGRAAFTPSVRVNADGVVGVTYYDFRNLEPDNATTLPTDYWFTRSTDGGASFGGEQHLAGPFDMKIAPNARGYFVGDYMGLDVIGNQFVPVFVEANSGDLSNRTDVLTTIVTP
jgi:hypothetical protein